MTAIKQRTLHGLFWAFIFIYPLLFLFQGFDLTDQGYMAAGYQYFFSHPEEISFTFAYWLTCFFGGLWMRIFGGLGLLGLRFFGALITWLTVYLYYRLLTAHKSLNKTVVLGALTLLLLLTYNYCRMFEYNRLSALLYAGAAYFLCRGLEEKKFLNIFLGAFLIGLNCFTRISNICGFLVLLVVFGYIIFFQKKTLSWQKAGGMLLGGFCAGVLSVLLLMFLLGHLSHFIFAIKSYADLGAGTESSHSVIGLLKQILTDNTLAVVYGALLTLGAGLFNIGATWLDKRNVPVSSKVTAAVLVLAVAGVALFWIEGRYSPLGANNMLIRGLNGVFYFSFAYALWQRYRKKTDDSLLLLHFVGIAIMVVTPLGSDNGLYNTLFSLYLVGALLVCRVWPKDNQRYLGVAVLLSLVALYGLRYAYNYNFRENAPRTALTFPMESEKLLGIFTNQRRAALTDEIVKTIKAACEPGESVIIYGSAPMLYYLTDTTPALNSTWAELYDSPLFLKIFDENIFDKNLKPKIICLNFNTNDNEWPVNNPNAYKSYVRAEDPRLGYVEAFMLENDYYKANPEHTLFDLFLPGE